MAGGKVEGHLQPFPRRHAMATYRELQDILGGMPPEEALLTHGCALFPLKPDALQTVFGGFENFLAMPSEERRRWTFGDPNDPDDGYLPRMGQARREGGYHDRKHAFHYRPNLIPLAQKAGVDLWTHLHWINGCKIVYDACAEALRNIVRQLDLRLPRLELAAKIREQETDYGGHVLRLLHYSTLPIKEGAELGKFHTDRSFLTLHVAESHPGLILRTNKSDLLYRAQPDRVLAFFGKKAEYGSAGVLKAVEHGIVAVAGAHGQPVSEPRRSIVFFSHIPFRHIPEQYHDRLR